jgi:hypothetical protein
MFLELAPEENISCPAIHWENISNPTAKIKNQEKQKTQILIPLVLYQYYR